LALAIAKIARIGKIKKSKLLSWSRANFVNFCHFGTRLSSFVPVVHSKGLAPTLSSLGRSLYLY
jgi:hypothetical protein